MKKIIAGLAAVFAVAAWTLPASADTLFLKNGNSIKGIIKNESEETVELEIEIGTVKFRKAEIERVERSNPAEYKNLRQTWEQGRQQDERERREQAAREKRQLESRPQSRKVTVDSKTGHVTVKATINTGITANLLVDTGATLVVLTKKVGDQLLKSGVSFNPGRRVQMTVGDGRKVEANFVSLDRVEIEGSAAENVAAAVLSDDADLSGCDGFLGMSFLNNFNFGFNLKEGKLTLQKR